MPSVFNIYCDESCHLENDGQKAMALGAVWCSAETVRDVSVRLREIKQKHGLGACFETKWSKVGARKLAFYLDCIDYFFDEAELHFRGLVVPNKQLLDHSKYGHDHDTWYYKMFFTLLKVVFDPSARYRVYIDIKDTRGQGKVEKLHEVLCNSTYDFKRQVISRVQRIRSHESELLQLADLLSGALSYAARELHGSKSKEALINRIRARSGYSLDRNTLYREGKFNLLVWSAGAQE